MAASITIPSDRLVDAAAQREVDAELIPRIVGVVSTHDVTVCSPVTKAKAIYAGPSQVRFLADGFFDDLQRTSSAIVFDIIVAVDAIFGAQVFLNQCYKALNLLSG